MSENYEQWRERMEREGTPDPPVIFAGNWARKCIEDLEAENERLRDAMREAAWMVQGHVTGPATLKIWLRYDAAMGRIEGQERKGA